MYQVWGEKMAKTIISNMERERDAGNLELGQVGDIVNNNPDPKLASIKGGKIKKESTAPLLSPPSCGCEKPKIKNDFLKGKA